MIAGGIGITPIRSIAEGLLTMGRDVVLIYANRTRQAIALEKELDALGESHRGFRMVHVLSDDATWTGERGRIDSDMIGRLAPDFAEREVFLCGPPPMMASVLKALATLKVPRNRIHYERFTL